MCIGVHYLLLLCVFCVGMGMCQEPQKNDGSCCFVLILIVKTSKYTALTILRCLGWRKRKREDHIPSYANALLRTDFESVETTVRRRRIFCAGFVARMGEVRLPRVMFGETLGGRGYSGGQELDWMKDVDEDLTAFGIKFDGCREASQKLSLIHI